MSVCVLMCLCISTKIQIKEHTMYLTMYIVKTHEKFWHRTIQMSRFFMHRPFLRNLKSRHRSVVLMRSVGISNAFDFTGSFCVSIYLSVYCPVLPVCLSSCLIENCTLCTLYTIYRISVHRARSTTSNIYFVCWITLDFIEIPNISHVRKYLKSERMLTLQISVWPMQHDITA